MYSPRACGDHIGVDAEAISAGSERGRVESVPPQAYFVGSAVFHYLGPSFAVLLFARVAPAGVAWLRIVSAAIVFACWRRPWRTLATVDAATVRLVAGLGVVLAVMNLCFYQAIDRLPLATVSAIEFLPVVVVAALGVRSARNGLALALSVGGVYVLTRVEFAGQPLGLSFAFANAGLFALYIVLAHRVAGNASLPRIDGLAASMLIAAIAITPIGGPAVVGHLLDPIAIGAGIGVGLTSSVIPYVCDQLAMARLPRATYALFVALLPAVAVVVGMVVLGQLPTVADLAGIALVMIGVACHRPAASGHGEADAGRVRAPQAGTLSREQRT
jgi:inner membrane transporter RhtA